MRTLRRACFLLPLLGGCHGVILACPEEIQWVDRIEGEVVVWDPSAGSDASRPPDAREGDAFLGETHLPKCTMKKREELRKRIHRLAKRFRKR